MTDSKLPPPMPPRTIRRTRTIYQFLQVRVQLLGRGITNEIMTIYVNGKRIKPQGVNTLHQFLNQLGKQGFQIVTAEMETEGVYTHFYTLQRQAFTTEPPQGDIYEMLRKTKEGADFGDSFRNLLEFTLFSDNF